MTTGSPATPRWLESLLAWRSRGWRPELVLVAVTVLAYQPAWNAGFIWDDDVYVTRNRLLAAPDGLKRIWFSLDSPSQYCPLVYTTFRLERNLWGLRPAGYHVVNILLHAVNAVLVLWLLRRLAVPGAWLGAALFALHPVHVESVAWITERKNVLSLLFFLMALLAWTRWVEEKSAQSRRLYVVALLWYALALLSKTTACILPAALILVLWLKRKPISRSRWMQVVPFVALGLGMGLLTIWWERHHQGTAGRIFALDWLERLLVASRAIFFYLGKLIWPANLTFSYPRWVINVADPLAYVWLIALAGLLVVVLMARRFVGRGLETALTFYVATLSPLLGFIMLYTFRYSFVADHYQYVASIGPLALVAAGISAVARKFGKRELFFATVFCGGLLLVLGTLTWRQCGMYADTETLWRTTLARNPNSYMAHNNLGTTLMRRGEIEPAIAEFNATLQLQPTYEIGHYNLGQALYRVGRIEEAIAAFDRAVELDPKYAAAHNNLANVLVRVGRVRDAVPHYELAVQLRPKSADIANNLAWLLATSPEATARNGERAIELARLAERLSGGANPVYLGTLAAAYAEAGRFSDALGIVQGALRLASLQHDTVLASVLAKQAELYEAGAPYRDATAPESPPASDQP